MEWLTKFLGGLWSFVQVLFMGALQAQLHALAPLALNIVTEVAADPSIVTNEARRNAALAKLGQAAAAASIQAGANALNLAIELAVANLRAQGK